MKKAFLLLLLILLVLPTFFRMLRPGIFSTQDFHFFRLVEFNKCFSDLQLPCRWSSDAALGYGEPVFNFYGQIPYLAGSLLHSAGLSLVDSFKGLFVLSLVLSFLSMFVLARRLWKDNLSAILSSVLYLYAPYRALDVWVRGALPEALAFAIFPLAILFFEKFLEKKDYKNLIFFSFSLTLLIITHNLSFLMFLVFLVGWIFFRLAQSHGWGLLKYLVLSLGLAFLLSSFYILPVLVESVYVNLGSTTTGYFDFRGHFAGIYQLFVSRYWGYGASLFGPEDSLSLSIGHVQWMLSLVILVLAIYKLRLKGAAKPLVLILIGWFYVYLTHNLSNFIWESIPTFWYIQFPWRFIGLAVFSFSIGAGWLATQVRTYKILVVASLVLLTVFLNQGFFKPDIWNISNDEKLSGGDIWVYQSRSSISDYWPVYANILPKEFAPDTVTIIYGGGEGVRLSKTSNKQVFNLSLSKNSRVVFPLTYFPGWKMYVNGVEKPISPDEELGLVTSDLSPGLQKIELVFLDTPIRKLGNYVSLASFLMALGFLLGRGRNEVEI